MSAATDCRDQRLVRAEILQREAGEIAAAMSKLAYFIGRVDERRRLRPTPQRRTA